jgi:phosphatidate phosphatase LPIN
VRWQVPTSAELRALHLRPGRNMITYTFETKMWGRQEVQTCAYLWEWNAKVVISDVDGTITKSDMLVRPPVKWFKLRALGTASRAKGCSG